MDDGWIKLHRSALEHAIFQDEKLWKLWCWCLLKANHKPGNYQGTVVPRGSFVTGKHIAKDELGVPPTTWFRRMRQLSEPPFECIDVKSGPKFTMVTVINYDTYQDSTEKSGTEMEPRWNRDGTEMAPIEEQQEQQESSLSQAKAFSGRLTTRYDTPEVRAILPRWIAHWPKVRDGATLTEDQLEVQLMETARRGWDATALCDSIVKSIAKHARNLLDPYEDQRTGNPSAASSKRQAEYPRLDTRRKGVSS